MAWGKLPPPGTKLGPCVEPCEHTDCAENRKTAAAVCPACNEQIGYDVPYTSYATEGRPGVPWHFICLNEWSELQRRRLSDATVDLEEAEECGDLEDRLAGAFKVADLDQQRARAAQALETEM